MRVRRRRRLSSAGACPRDVRRCPRLSEIARGVGSRRLFSNVSVDVQPGRHLLVMGNSGTGKSSMLRAIVERRAVAEHTCMDCDRLYCAACSSHIHAKPRTSLVGEKKLC